MVETRGARHRLPEREFNADDLVIDIEAPKSPFLNAHSSAPLESQNEDWDRYQCFRRHLEHQYGPGKIKFKGQDDFLDVEPDQILVDNVYGYYEVQHWPGAQDQLLKSKLLLAPLKGEHGDTDSSLSSSVSQSSFSYHEDEDQVDDEDEDAEEDGLQHLPSEAHTIEDDTEGAIHQQTPASAIGRRHDALKSGPSLHDFTSVPVRPQRQNARGARSLQTSPTPRRRQRRRPARVSTEVQTSSQPSQSEYGTLPPQSSTVPLLDSDASVLLASNRNSKYDTLPPPHRLDSAAAIIARLDQRLQRDKDNGLISPSSGRYYTKYERDVRAGLKPGKLTKGTYSRLKREKPEYFDHDTGELDDSKIIADASKSNASLPSKRRKLSDTSKPSGRLQPGIPPPRTHNLQDHFELEPCPPNFHFQEKIYPSIAQGLMLNNTLLWPIEATTRDSLPTGYQVRVQYVANAHSYAPSSRNQHTPQQMKVKECVVELYEALMYMHLTVDKFQEMEIDAVTKTVHKLMLTKMKLFEKKWQGMMDALSIQYELPNAIDFGRKRGGKMEAGTRRQTATPAPSDEGSGGHRGSAGNIDLNDQAHPGFSAVVANGPTIEDFPPIMLYFTNRQLSYLVQTIRLQTATPRVLKIDSSSAPSGGVSKARRQFEANMQLAGMSWQVEFFESWIRGVQRKKLETIAEGGHRFWKVRTDGRRDDEAGKKAPKVRRPWKGMDLLTGMMGRVRADWKAPRREYTGNDVEKILEKHERLEEGFELMDEKTGNAERAKEWTRLIEEAAAGKNSQVDGRLRHDNNGGEEGALEKAVRLSAVRKCCALPDPHPAPTQHGLEEAAPIGPVTAYLTTTSSQQYQSSLSQLDNTDRLMPPPPPPASRSSFTPTLNLIQQQPDARTHSPGTFLGPALHCSNNGFSALVAPGKECMPNIDPRLIQISREQEARSTRERFRLEEQAPKQGDFQQLDLGTAQQQNGSTAMNHGLVATMPRLGQEQFSLSLPVEQPKFPQAFHQNVTRSRPLWKRGFHDPGQQRQRYAQLWPYSPSNLRISSTQGQALSRVQVPRYGYPNHAENFSTAFSLDHTSILTQPFAQPELNTPLQAPVAYLQQYGCVPVLPSQQYVSQGPHPNALGGTIGMDSRIGFGDIDLGDHAVDMNINHDSSHKHTSRTPRLNDISNRIRPTDQLMFYPSTPTALHTGNDLSNIDAFDEDEMVIDAGPPPSPLLMGITAQTNAVRGFDDAPAKVNHNEKSKLAGFSMLVDEKVEQEGVEVDGIRNSSLDEAPPNLDASRKALIVEDLIAPLMQDEGISLSFDARAESIANANFNDAIAAKPVIFRNCGADINDNVGGAAVKKHATPPCSYGYTNLIAPQSAQRYSRSEPVSSIDRVTEGDYLGLNEVKTGSEDNTDLISEVTDMVKPTRCRKIDGEGKGEDEGKSKSKAKHQLNPHSDLNGDHGHAIKANLPPETTPGFFGAPGLAPSTTAATTPAAMNSSTATDSAAVSAAATHGTDYDQESYPQAMVYGHDDGWKSLSSTWWSL